MKQKKTKNKKTQKNIKKPKKNKKQKKKHKKSKTKSQKKKKQTKKPHETNKRSHKKKNYLNTAQGKKKIINKHWKGKKNKGRLIYTNGDKWCSNRKWSCHVFGLFLATSLHITLSMFECYQLVTCLRCMAGHRSLGIPR